MSDDTDDDDFVTLGTALNPLDEERMPNKKACTVENQIAADSNGRRRFHGAFTGGFSAGFMNTVGSLEGWKPSEFKSTRGERNLIKTQRPEDFMDDEDVGEFGIAPKRLMAKAEYSGGDRRKRPVPNFHEGTIPGNPVLDDILRPVRETFGVKLLKNMGWKPGQGIGPRISKKEKKRMYGCAIAPNSQESDSDSDYEIENVTYAPEDVKPFIVVPKKDTFGLGYSGLDRKSVLGVPNISSHLKFTDRNKKVNIHGQGFGVGALENDDEDIYSKEDMSQYDFELGGETPAIKSIRHSSLPGLLEGFVLSKRKVVKKEFPPPVLPPGFRPGHVIRKSRFEVQPISSTAAKPAGLGRHDVSPDARAAMLGEASPCLQTISLETATDTKASTSQTKVKPMDSSSSQFRPFQLDPDKQRRYEQYLKLSDKTELKELQPFHLNEWEKERERKEFEQAEKIFKPLTGVMSDRFTTASQQEDLNNPMAVVEKVLHGKKDQIEAAKLKMFGPLTREESSWRPCSLICKRFNVPEPDTRPAITQERKKFSILDDSFDYLIKREPPSPSPSVVGRSSDCPTMSEETSRSSSIKAEISLPKPMESIESQERLFEDSVSKVDLFKAIFLDSSEEEDNLTEEKPLAIDVSYDEPVVNNTRNTSPPSGLFANVDLDALATQATYIPPPQPIIIISSKETKEVDSKSEEIDKLYGPKLPDKIYPSSTNNMILDSSSSSSDSESNWIEKTKCHSKKGKKSKKHKKHKSKHKKKKNKK